MFNPVRFETATLTQQLYQEESLNKALAKSVGSDIGNQALIKQGLSELNLTLTNQMARDVLYMVAEWETRPTHIMSLNTPLLGVYPMAFTQEDRQRLFHVVNTDQGVVDSILRTIPSVNQDRHTISDAFNILTMWLLYLSTLYLKGEHRRTFQLCLSKYIRYCFFSAAVRRAFPKCNANESVMQSTIENLSAKFNIKTDGTWRSSLEIMAEEFISETSIHQRTINSFAPDKAVFYAISDMATRVNSRVFTVAEEYYARHAQGDKVTTTTTMVQTEDGDSTQRVKIVPVDAMLSHVVPSILNRRTWVSQETASAVSKEYSAISMGSLMAVLDDMYQLATYQKSKGTFREYTTNKDGSVTPMGVGAVIEYLIRNTYRYVNTKVLQSTKGQKSEVYLAVKNIYSASRIKDDYIVTAKEAVSRIVDSFERSTRPATMSSMRIAVILYIIRRTFAYW